MAALWYKNTDGTWVNAPAVLNRTDTGWVFGDSVWEKVAGTWTQRWVRDVTPPAAPHAPTFSLNSTTRVATISIIMPSDADTTQMLMKWSNVGYASVPSTDPETGQQIDTDIQSDGTAWSYRSVTPGQTVTRELDNVGPSTCYITVWAQDKAGNWSKPSYGNFTMSPPPPPPPTTVTKTAVFNCTSSASYQVDTNWWRTDNNYVYQAGTHDSQGFWFYNGQIRSALAKAKSIQKMTIKITRASSGGVSGAANIYLCYHNLANKPSGVGTGYLHAAIYVGALSPGQTGTYTVPSSFYGYFQNGTAQGFGLFIGYTSFTDPKYFIALGGGTTSGQVYLQWTE